jgi:DNA adenine methylase
MCKAPFPYFGGKATIAHKIWYYLGNPKTYIEPFFGSGAVLLNRPHENSYEIVNDKDAFICNVWRAIQYSPDETAKWCDWPVNHADLMARRIVLLSKEKYLLDNLVRDDMWHDCKLAGYWIWAASCWIGGGLTSMKARPHIVKNAGINSKIPRLTKNQGISSQIPRLTDNQGINGKRPYLTKDNGINANGNIYAWFQQLSNRLRNVKVVCGNWDRVCGGDWQDDSGIVGIYFDPPYATEVRNKNIYHHDSLTVGQDVEKWCLQRGNKPTYRIVISGYDGEYLSLIKAGWQTEAWQTQGGYANQSKNKKQVENKTLESLFISPHCNQNLKLF